MTSKKIIIGVLVMLVGLGRYSSARDEQAIDPQQLLDAAHKVSDLSPLGSYVLTARVVASPGDSKRERIGTLTISHDHDLSRVELKIDGKDEVQIHRNHVSYVVPSQTLLPASGIIGFDQSWDPLRWRETGSGDKYQLGKAHAENIGEHRAWCFDKKTTYMKFTSTEKLCVDASLPGLLRRGVGTKSRTEFMDYTQLGAQEYPQRVSIIRELMAPIEVTDIHIVQATLSGDLFKAPENAIEVESCANTQYPQPKRTPEPTFPARASAKSNQGMVTLNVIVAKDGTVALARSLTSDDYGFSESAEKTVRTWQFKPATCEGRAIAIEMNVEVSFNRL